MIRTYLAGPLRGSLGDKATPRHIVYNTRQAREHAEILWQLGFAVFCPHLNTHEMVGMLPDESTFLEGDLEWLQFAELVVILPGWQTSTGARIERTRAEALELPILYVMHQTLSFSTNMHWEYPITGKLFTEVDMLRIAKEGIFNDFP